GMATLRLNAAECEHEAARGIAPVRAKRHRACNVECGNDLPARPDLDAITGAYPNKRVVNEGESFPQRHAEMVDELQRGRTGATFFAINDDEIGIVPGRHHGLANRQEFPWMADAELEAGGLPDREPPHLSDKGYELNRGRERRVLRGRNAVLSHRYAARECNLTADLGGRQDAAVPRFGALAEFQLDHLDLFGRSCLGELFGAERAVAVATAEIARTDLPDDG